MKFKLRSLSLMFSLIMILSVLLTACGDVTGETTTAATADVTTESTTAVTDSEKSEANTTETLGDTSEDTVTKDCGEDSETDESETVTTDATTESNKPDNTDTEADTDIDVDSDYSSEVTTSEIEETTKEENNAGSIIDKPTKDPDRFNKPYAPVLYMGPNYIAEATEPYAWGENGSSMLGGFLSEDKSYVTLYPFDGEPESLFYLFQSSTKVGPIMAIKYRASVSGFYMEFFMNSSSNTAQSGDNFHVRGLKVGEWAVKYVDISDKLGDAFNGSTLGHIRFDFANGSPIPDMTELDIEYIAFFNSIEDAQKFENGEDYVVPDSMKGETDDKANHFINAIDIESAACDNSVKNLADFALADDNSYVTLTAKKGGKEDGYINIVTSSKSAGRYFAMKYRTEDLGYWIEIFTDSKNTTATKGSNFTFYPINDGEWHVIVIDVMSKLDSTVYNGEKINYLRFDFMNINADQTFGDWTLDVAYIGFYNDLNDAKGKDYDPNAPVNIFDAETIKNAVDAKNTNVKSATLSEDKSYVTIEAAKDSTNAYAYIFTSKRAAAKYLVVKYKTSFSNFYTQLFMNSGAYTASSASKITIEGFPRNDKWQYGIFNISEKLGENQFNDQYLSHFRFDFIHQSGDNPAPEGVTLDVGFIAFFDSLEAAEAYADADRPADEGENPDDGNTPDDGKLENAYFDAEAIAAAANKVGNKNVDAVLLSENKQFVTLCAKEGGKDDAYIKLLTEKKATAGAFFAIKYRANNSGYWVEFFMDSVNSEATGGSNFNFTPEKVGEWDIFVLNLSEKLGSGKFDGETVNYIRFDFVNKTTLGKWSIDVAEMGFYASEEEALEALSGEITDEPTIVDNGPAFIMDANYIKNKIDAKNSGVESATVKEDGAYITIDPENDASEAQSYMFTTDTSVARYMVIKFRTESSGVYMEIYANSNDHTAGNGKFNVEGINANGQWQYRVIDLATIGDKFDGSNLGHFRFDFINGTIDSSTSMDIAYVAFFTSQSAAEAYAAQ